MKKTLLTVGDIVREAGFPVHKVEYAISSRKIAPTQRAGRFRLFSPERVDEIKRVLASMSGHPQG